MTENNAPLMLQIIGDVCCLMLYHADSRYNTFNMFRTVGELLCVFLNGEHTEKLFPEGEEKEAAARGAGIKNEDAFRAWLGGYNRERYMQIVQDIYLSEDKFINSLKPSQRLQIYLNFDQYGLVSSLTEQAFSNMKLTLKNSSDLLGKYEFESLMLLLKTGEVTLQEDFSHACKFLQEHGVEVPRGTSYMFASPDELIQWLLRYVIEQDKYIKRCEFCGRYFVPKRNTKKYCSDLCASRQREEDSFCGVPEIRTLYKRIVANLTDKAERQRKLKMLYYSSGCSEDSETYVDPKVVLKKFYSDNVEYINALRTVHYALHTEEPSEEMQNFWEIMKKTYLEWLQEQYDYATSLTLDRNSYYPGD